jgi:hypothetical protein
MILLARPILRQDNSRACQVRHAPFGGVKTAEVNASLLARRRCGVCVIRVWLVGFVMSDRASCRCSELSVSHHVPGNATHEGALDASFRFRWRD